MSTAPRPPDLLETPPAAPPSERSTDGLSPALLDDLAERRFDQIEMLGEEQAAGFQSADPSGKLVTVGMRYLHSSRTVQQLINDRNRAVGIFLAVASLLWTGSATLLNAHPQDPLLVPVGQVQRWCLPATFLILTVLALFVALLLVRTRVGLIYEVAKMNTLMGLPVGRVQRVNPLSIFFLMHLAISLAGGLCGGLFAHQLLYLPLGAPTASLYALGAGVLVCLFLIIVYVGMVLYTTRDLERAAQP